MATTGSGTNASMMSARTQMQMKFSIEDSGTCSHGNRVLNYRIDRGMIRQNTGYYDGAYAVSSDMHWYVDNVEMKSWRWDVNWPWQRWTTGNWWLDYQTGSFESTKMNGTYYVKIRWHTPADSPWSNVNFDLGGNLYVGGCCTNTAPTGISGWASNVQAFRLTNNGSIKRWGTECSNSTTREQESTISTYTKRYYDYRDFEVINTGLASKSMSYTHTNLTPNTKYYLDACFRNKVNLQAVVRVNDYYQYSATTSLESPTVRIIYLDSRSIKFNWAQLLGGKASGGEVYYCITPRGSSTSLTNANIQCGSFTTSTSETFISGSCDSWVDGFKLNPSTDYDLLVWSNNVRNSEITRISFTTDRASTLIVDSIKNKVQSSATFVTRIQNARYYDIGTSEVTSNVDTSRLYLSTASNPDSVPGGFGRVLTHPKGYWKCRYIRLQMGRSNVDTYRYLLKWKVLDTAGTDVAAGRSTISGWTNSINATNTDYSNYAHTTGTSWLTLDLGSIQTIKETILYPYYDSRNNQNTTSATVLSNTRAYADVNIEISEDGTDYKNVYSSGSEYTVATYAAMKADGTAPGTGQPERDLFGFRIVPDSETVPVTLSNLNKNSVAIANNTRILPGQTYNLISSTTDRHYDSVWTTLRTVEFPVAQRIKPDGSIIDYRLWRIRPNGQKFKMTGSIIDRTQD